MSSNHLSKSPPSTAAPPCNLKLNTHAAVLAAAVSSVSIHQQPQVMQHARTTVPQLQCCVCKEDSSGSDGCLCCGDAPGHFFCNECFSNMVISQVTGEGKPVFLSNGCHVSCPICQASGLRSVFDMQLYSPQLTRGAYSAYLSAIAEPEVLREQREWQQRLERQEANYNARLNIVKCTAGDAMNDPHVKHIAEQLILPRCPTCKNFISDFEACAALQVSFLERCWVLLYPNSTSPPQPFICSAVAFLHEATSQVWDVVLTSAHGACTCAVTKTTATTTFAPALTTPTMATFFHRSRTRRRGCE